MESFTPEVASRLLSASAASMAAEVRALPSELKQLVELSQAFAWPSMGNAQLFSR